MQEVPAHLERTLHSANSQLSTPFAWQALKTVRSVEVELGPKRLQRTPSIAAATSSLNSSALCNAPFILTISSSHEAIWPAGSLCSRAAFRLRW
jgi:hypothetical protein